jgi:hypothetical protein
MPLRPGPAFYIPEASRAQDGAVRLSNNCERDRGADIFPSEGGVDVGRGRGFASGYGTPLVEFRIVTSGGGEAFDVAMV